MDEATISRILTKPRGEMKIVVHLRRGTNADAKGAQDKKTLVSDVIALQEVVNPINEAIAAGSVRGVGPDADDTIKMRVIVRALWELVGPMAMLGNRLEHLTITISDNPVFIHPDDVSYIEIRANGDFQKLIGYAREQNA